MSWKAYDFESREHIGTYPDEMSMSEGLRKNYPDGYRFVVENDDGAQFEATLDGTIAITLDPPLAELELEHLMDDANYSPYPRS